MRRQIPIHRDLRRWRSNFEMDIALSSPLRPCHPSRTTEMERSSQFGRCQEGSCLCRESIAEFGVPYYKHCLAQGHSVFWTSEQMFGIHLIFTPRSTGHLPPDLSPGVNITFISHRASISRDFFRIPGYQNSYQFPVLDFYPNNCTPIQPDLSGTSSNCPFPWTSGFP